MVASQLHSAPTSAKLRATVTDAMIAALYGNLRANNFAPVRSLTKFNCAIPEVFVYRIKPSLLISKLYRS